MFGDMVSIVLEGKPDKNLVLVTGRAHPKLARDVADQLGIDVLETTAYDFANGEMYVRYTPVSYTHLTLPTSDLV